MIDTKSTGIRISEMAIRGLLSKRVKPSLSIDNIVENIKTEREYLIKEKATKISKVSSMLDDETFEVPSGWKWVALGDLCILLSRGKSPKYSEVKKYPVFAQKCNQPNCLALDKALFLDETTLDKWPEYFRLREADVVINSTGTGTVGRVGYYTTETLDSNYEFMLPDSHVTVVRTGKNVSSRYLYYALRTATIQNIMEKTFRGSTNQKEFYIDSVYSIPIPLPPVEEQEEIVKILDSAFEQLSIIDDLQTKYSNDLAVLKSKIIDAGIQGKLTEQLPEDGDAEDLYVQILNQKSQLIKEGKIKKEKPLPDIAADEIPFEIPKNWKWVHLGDIFEHNTGKALNSADKDGELMEYITTSNMYWEHFELDSLKKMFFKKSEIEKCTIKKGDLLICEGGDIGRSAIWNFDYEMRIQNHIHKLRGYGGINHKYYYYMMRDYKDRGIIDGRGIGLQGFSSKRVHSLVAPLPPIAEQNRIVAKIEAIMEQIN